MTGETSRKSAVTSMFNLRARLGYRYTPSGGRWAAQYFVAASAITALVLMHASSVAGALLEDNGKVKVAALAPLGAAWLIWSRRGELRGIPARAWWPGLVLVAMASTLLVLGEVAGVNFWSHGALIATLWATVATALGLRVARALARPMLFLLFAANIFFPFEPLLMHASARMGAHVLWLTGPTVQLHDLTIVSPVGSWQVTEACSGLEYVLIFAMAATLYASLAFDSKLRKLLFVLGAVLAAVMANGLRFWALVYAAYLRDGVDLDHAVIGYLAFSLVFCVLIFVGYRISAIAPDKPEHAFPRVTIVPGALRGTCLAASAALVILASTAVAATAVERRAQPQAALDGCRQIDQVSLVRDGQSVIRTRTQCRGPTGRRQLPEVARALLRQVVPQATLVNGVQSLVAERSGAIDAATLTTLDTVVRYRLTYWYALDDKETGSWEALKWHIALALLTDRDATVTVVAELQQLSDDPR